MKLNENGGQRRATGWEFVHVFVDDATRLAYVEVPPDEKGTTAAGFLRRAVNWFKGMRIQVTTAPATAPPCMLRPARSSTCRHIFTRPY